MLVFLFAALAWAGPTVSLLSAGDAPRAPLRLAWTDGAQHYTEVTTSHVEVQLGGLLTDPEPADTTQRLAWIARSKANALSVELIGASFRTTSDDPGPDPGELVGLTGNLVVDDRGRNISYGVTPPKGVLSDEVRTRVDGMGRRVQQVGLPLPEEAVGAGARWRIVDRLDIGSMVLTVVTTATLLERDGDTVKVRLSFAISEPPANADIALDGFHGKVKELWVRSTQDITLRLDRPVALERVGNIRTHLVVRGWKGPFPVTVTMDVDQRIRATARER